MTYQPPTGEEVKALLAALGLTQTEAAELLCVHPRSVEKWMYGERPMPFTALFTLVGRAAWVDLSPEQWRKDVDLEVNDVDVRGSMGARKEDGR